MISKFKSRPYPHSSYFWELIRTSYLLSKWRFSCSVNGHGNPPPPLLPLIIEPRIVIIFWTQNPISLKHVSYCYSLLKPNQPTLKYGSFSKEGNRIRYLDDVALLELLRRGGGSWYVNGWPWLHRKGTWNKIRLKGLTPWKGSGWAGGLKATEASRALWNSEGASPSYGERPRG